MKIQIPVNDTGSFKHRNSTKTATESKCQWIHSVSNIVLHATLEVYMVKPKEIKKQKWLHIYAQKYKEEIHKVREETRKHVSKWCLYPLRAFDRVVNGLNFAQVPFLNPSICSQIKQSQTTSVWTVLQHCHCTAETASDACVQKVIHIYKQ